MKYIDYMSVSRGYVKCKVLFYRMSVKNTIQVTTVTLFIASTVLLCSQLSV